VSPEQPASTGADVTDPHRRPPEDFSLVLGGPLFQLLRRSRLSDDALSLLRRRIVVLSLVAWLPLLVLSVTSGELLAGVTVPFLLDVEVHTRFLVALPLLIAAEQVVHQRMRTLMSTFVDRRLVPDAATARLEAALAGAYRLRNSVTAEVLLLALVYFVGITIVWRQYTTLDAATWYAVPTPGGSQLTPAGIWYGYVSLPIFQFLLCRWYFRLLIWTRLLWQVSRIELRLVPTHPDRLGGLGFLAATSHAFVPLLMAHGALLAGFVGNRIFHLGASLVDYRLEILLLAVFMLCLVAAPLLVFTPQLSRVKRAGLREYGTLAQRYVREYDGKWLRGGAGNEPFIGSPDISGLGDLGGGFAFVQEMRVVPLTRDAMVVLVLATLAPIAPLLLTMMPLDELLKRLLGVLF
jgi:hypothetical protein